MAQVPATLFTSRVFSPPTWLVISFSPVFGVVLTGWLQAVQ